MRRPTAPTAAVNGTILLLSGTLTGCSGTTAASSDAPTAAIGIDVPRADSDFWKAYERYLREDIVAQHLNVLPLTQSDGDTAKSNRPGN